MGVFSNVRLRVTYHTVVCVAMSSAPKLQGLKIGCYPKGYAAPSDVPCQCNMRRSPSKLKRTLPQSKIYVTSKSPVGDISVVTLIRTDTTLDHSQKAEKVCPQQIHWRVNGSKPEHPGNWKPSEHRSKPGITLCSHSPLPFPSQLVEARKPPTS